MRTPESDILLTKKKEECNGCRRRKDVNEGVIHLLLRFAYCVTNFRR